MRGKNIVYIYQSPPIMNQRLSLKESQSVLKFWQRDHPEEYGATTRREQAEKIVAEELCCIVSRPKVLTNRQSSKRKVHKHSRTKKRDSRSTY